MNQKQELRQQDSVLSEIKIPRYLIFDDKTNLLIKYLNILCLHFYQINEDKGMSTF